MRDHKDCICATESDPFVPCPAPREAHREGIEIHEGPWVERGRLFYQYTIFWYRDDTKRQKAQEFRSIADPIEARWDKAMEVYMQTDIYKRYAARHGADL